MDAPVPRWLRLVAAYGWRLLIAATVAAVAIWLLVRLRLVVLPTFLALFAAALLHPVFEWLERLRIPPAAAAFATVTGAVALLAGLAVVVVPPFADQLADLEQDLEAGIDDLEAWLDTGPLNLTAAQIDDAVDQGLERLRDNADTIASGALSGVLTAVEVLAGLLLALVLTFFFLKDGDRLWRAVVGLFPAPRRRDLEQIGLRVWPMLRRYIGGVTIVALVDAVFIGLALVLLGVPAALPLAIFVFFGAYVPIVGAVATGALAVLVALVSEGPLTALGVLGAVIAVQQLEGNVLQPVVVGRAIALHPVVVLLAVTTGAVVWGIVGALVAVPIAMVVARVGGYLRDRERAGGVVRTVDAPEPAER